MSQDLEKTLLCDDPVAACAAFRVLHARLRSEIGRVLVGQEDVVDGHAPVDPDRQARHVPPPVRACATWQSTLPPHT